SCLDRHIRPPPDKCHGRGARRLEGDLTSAMEGCDRWSFIDRQTKRTIRRAERWDAFCRGHGARGSPLVLRSGHPVTHAALYARLSRDRTGEETATARQIEDCRAFAALKGWE